MAPRHSRWPCLELWTLEFIQSLISDSTQPTDLPPRDMVDGNTPSAIRAYIVDRERPVRDLTSLRRRITSVLLSIRCSSKGSRHACRS